MGRLRWLQPCLLLIQAILVTSTNPFLRPSSSSPRRIRSRTYHEETSFALVETPTGLRGTQSKSVFDVEEEVAESLSNVHQLRIFEEGSTPRNVTGQIGHSVFLHCLVEPIGDKMVSWLRLRDFHLLTVGLFTYTSDDRFVVRHGTLQSNDWALQIKHVVPSDEGIYECQVNTDPPRSLYYRLSVVVPETKMIGSPDMFVRAGQSLNLTCVINNSPELPTVVFWYHNDRVVNYDLDGDRGSISLAKTPSFSDSLMSRLFIRSARLTDSGNYSCHFVGSSADPAHIYVHVLQGERRQSSTDSIVGHPVGPIVSGHNPLNVQNDERLFSSSSPSSAFLLTSGLSLTILILSGYLIANYNFRCP